MKGADADRPRFQITSYKHPPPEHDERLGGRDVLERDAGFRGGFGGEELVFGKLVEAQQFRAVEAQLVCRAIALHDDD
jgi:hypothetical protein